MKKTLLTFGVAFLLVASSMAQSSEKISEILAANNVTVGQIAYLAGTCGNGLDEKTNYTGALAAMQKKGLIPKEFKASDKVTAQMAAGIFMKSSNMKGGILYRIFKNDRYAFKELKSIGAIPSNIDPKTNISGRDALAILNETLSN